MPVTKSAHKALRRDRRRAKVNQRRSNLLKKEMRLWRRSPNPKTFPKVVSLLDRAAKNKIIRKQKSARIKSRLAKLINQPLETLKKIPKTVVQKRTKPTKKS